MLPANFSLGQEVLGKCIPDAGTTVMVYLYKSNVRISLYIGRSLLQKVLGKYPISITKSEEFILLSLISQSQVEAACLKSFQFFPSDDSGHLGKALVEFVYLLPPFLTLTHIDNEDMKVGVVLVNAS